MIRSGLDHAVKSIYNEREEDGSGVIHMITIDLLERMRITGAYVSPSSTTAAFTNFISQTITNGTGRDWVVGDLNAREISWDTTSNACGRALRHKLTDTRHRILTPQAPTYHARARKGSSTPDIAMTNVQGCKIEVRKLGIWEGASDHAPIKVLVPGPTAGEIEERRRRVSKAVINNRDMRKSAKNRTQHRSPH